MHGLNKTRISYKKKKNELKIWTSIVGKKMIKNYDGYSNIWVANKIANTEFCDKKKGCILLSLKFVIVMW